MFFAPRKHQYADPGLRPMPDLAPNWIGYVCISCGHRSGLDDWQIFDMPKEMAICPSDDAPRMTLWEFLWGEIDCMAPQSGARGLLAWVIVRLRAGGPPSTLVN